MQVYYRSSPDELWLMQWFRGEDADVTLRSMDVTLKMSDMYHKTKGL